MVISIALLLFGCPYVGNNDYELNVRDADGDGVISDRFGGPDCDDADPNIRDCDADNDGYVDARLGGTDCDDTRPDVFPDAPELCDGVDNDCDGRTDDEDDVLPEN